MSPSKVTIHGQDIIILHDNEDCPISDKDLFEDYKLHDEIITVRNSKFFVPNYDVDLVQSSINNSKNYFEFYFLEKLDEYLPKNAIILDVGANIGNHTLYWANERNAHKVYAFEPIPYTFNILRKNVEINNLQDRVLLYNCGIADKAGKAEIKVFCRQNIGGTRLRVLKSDTQTTFPLKSLDSFNIKEDRVNLLKIDVEGMDNEVLTGAEKTIKKYKPIIMIESFHDSYEKSNAILENYGYKQEYDFGSCEYLYVYKD